MAVSAGPEAGEQMVCGETDSTQPVKKKGAHGSDTDGAGVLDKRTDVKLNTRNQVLPPKEVNREFIKGTPDDVEGFKQLLFHGLFVVATWLWIARARGPRGSWTELALAELAAGLVVSFYFAAFHEMIHGTAFGTRMVNKALSQLMGFLIFRGANWYYYFHWHHHRFTNDPDRDPELSGSTVDRADPTKVDGFWSRVGSHALFLSGYPFGFERLPGMFTHAFGTPAPEMWIDSDDKKRTVQQEYRVYVTLYAVLAVLAALRPSTVGANLWFYWLLPHICGAGHLRYYQTAEHRACQTSADVTDLSAWAVSRTTATWWIYCQLAWNMPYHQEHHAWPNVPFHMLPKLHARVRAQGARPSTGCTPDGEHGFLWMHWVILQQVLSGEDGADVSAAKAR